MRVLVTGAAGYIGSALVGQLLKRRYEVVAIDNLMYDQTNLLGFIDNPLFTFHKMDVHEDRHKLFESKLFEVVDAIVPLAGIVGAPACKKNPTLSSAVNMDAICRLSGYKNQFIIYPNTNSGYGTKSGTRYCTEETKLEPISEYGIQKVTTERHLMDHHGNAVSFRLATVFGVSSRMRWDLLVNGLVYSALKNGYIVLYEPHAARNYIHIQDVVDCFIFSLENQSKVKGQVFNLGLDDANFTKLELAELVKAQTNCEIFTSPRSIDPDKRNYIVSNKKLKKAGFSAMFSVEDGIQELIIAYEMMPKKEPWRNV